LTIDSSMTTTNCVIASRASRHVLPAHRGEVWGHGVVLQEWADGDSDDVAARLRQIGRPCRAAASPAVDRARRCAAGAGCPRGWRWSSWRWAVMESVQLKGGRARRSRTWLLVTRPLSWPRQTTSTTRPRGCRCGSAGPRSPHPGCPGRRAGHSTARSADTASGAVTDRPELAGVMDALRPGDTLVVWRLDRLGRSLPHLIETVRDLAVRGWGFGRCRQRSTPPPPWGRLVFHIFGSLAEFERDLIRERTMAGLAAARRRGRVGGRPTVMTAAKSKQATRMVTAGAHRPRSARCSGSAAPPCTATSRPPDPSVNGLEGVFSRAGPPGRWRRSARRGAGASTPCSRRARRRRRRTRRAGWRGRPALARRRGSWSRPNGRSGRR